MNQPQPNTRAPRAPLDLWTITATEFFHLIESFKEVASSLDLSLAFVGQLCTVEGHVFQLVVGDAKPAYPSRAHGTPPRSLAHANAGMLMADAAKKLRGVSASRILKQTDGTSRWWLILPNGVEVVAWVKPQTENEPETPAEPAQAGGEGTDSAPTPQTPPCGQPGSDSGLPTAVAGAPLAPSTANAGEEGIANRANPIPPNTETRLGGDEEEEEEDVVWSSFHYEDRRQSPSVSEFVYLPEHWAELLTEYTAENPVEIECRALTAREYSGPHPDYDPLEEPSFGFGEQFQGKRTLREFFVANRMPVPSLPDGGGELQPPTRWVPFILSDAENRIHHYVYSSSEWDKLVAKYKSEDPLGVAALLLTAKEYEGLNIEENSQPKFGFGKDYTGWRTLREFLTQHGMTIPHNEDPGIGGGREPDAPPPSTNEVPKSAAWKSFRFIDRTQAPAADQQISSRRQWEELKAFYRYMVLSSADLDDMLREAREYTGPDDYSPDFPEFGFSHDHQGSRTLSDFFSENGMILPPDDEDDDEDEDENGGGEQPIPPPPNTPPSGEKFAAGEQVELTESIYLHQYKGPRYTLLALTAGKILRQHEVFADCYFVEFDGRESRPTLVAASVLRKVKPDEKFAAGKNTPDIFAQAAATLLNKPVEEVTPEQRDALHTLIRSLPHSPHEPTPPHTADANQTSGDSEIQKMPVWQRMKEGSPKQDKEIANPNHSPKEMQSVQIAEEEPFDALHAALDAASRMPPIEVGMRINMHKSPGPPPISSGCTVLAGISTSIGIDTGHEPSHSRYGILRERDKVQVLAAAKLGEDAGRVLVHGIGKDSFVRELESQPSGAFRPADIERHALARTLAIQQQDKRDALEGAIAASAVVPLSHLRPVPEEPAALTPEEIEQTAAEAFAELQPIGAGDRVALTKQIDNIYGALPVGAEGTAIQKVGGSLVMVDFDGAPFQQSVSIDRLRRLPPLSPPAPAQKFAVGDRVRLTDTIGQIADALVAGREGIVRTTWDDSNRSALVEFDHKPGYRFCVHSTRLQKVEEPAPTNTPPASSVNPDWTEAEREAIARLAKEKDMSPQGVLRQSLRTYQMFHHARRDPNGPDGQAWRELAQLPPPPSQKPDAMIEPISAAIYRGQPVRVLGYEITHTHYQQRKPEIKYYIEDSHGMRVWVDAKHISPVTPNA